MRVRDSSATQIFFRKKWMMQHITNIFLQKCKQQHLNELKTPWVLIGASNSGHPIIAYSLRQLTKCNIL